MSFSDYARAGWKLCAVPIGTKGPTNFGWNTKPIPPDALDGLDGAGLLHVLSGTCCLDLDNLSAARQWLGERGVNVDALLQADDAVRIDSGRPNRAKLLYRMKVPLRTFKPKNSGLELRCATREGKSVQDVLPPSIHPDTKKPYQWLCGIAGDWRTLPAIPAGLLTVWRSLTEGDASPEIETAHESPKVDLERLRKAAFKHSPDAEYDEWLKVGMQLHDGTGGAQEGFDVWAQWSRGIKRKPYPGDSLLKTHWLSFGSSPGKHVATGAALAAELPAEADEFPIEPATEEVIIGNLKLSRKAAIETLEKRLVFVRASERYFDVEHHKLIGSDNALEHLFTSMMPRNKNGRMSPVRVLKASGTKRFVEALGFHPGEKVIFANSHGDEFANTYKPQLPEPLEPTVAELGRIKWLFDRIDDTVYRQWLLQFYGHVVQFPGVKIKSAPLIWSETQGNGKTTLLKMIPMLLVGARYSREVTCSLLNSDFNDYLLNAWHVNLTEFRAGSRGERSAIAQRLRAWITDDDIAMHPKGLPAYSMPNHFFVTATSNEDDAAAIDNNDRRWAIHEMHANQFTEKEQNWIYNEFLLTPRAAGVLRHFFLHTPITDFRSSAKALDTEARRSMVRSSMAADVELLQTAWEQYSEPLDKEVVIVADVADYVRKNCPAKPSADRVGKILSRAPYDGVAVRFRVGKSRYRAVVIRNHARWVGAKGHELMGHISKNDVDLAN